MRRFDAREDHLHDAETRGRGDAETGGPEDISPRHRVTASPRLDSVSLFKQSIEAVDGHCIIAHSKAEIADALTQIISALQKTKLRAQRIAISDAPEVERLMHMTDLEIEELGIAPSASETFGFDVGITTAQAAIAETGTLVLDSDARTPSTRFTRAAGSYRHRRCFNDLRNSRRNAFDCCITAKSLARRSLSSLVHRAPPISS